MPQGATEGNVPPKQGSKSSKRKTQNPGNSASNSVKDNDPKNNSEERYQKNSCATGLDSQQTPLEQDGNTRQMSPKRRNGENT